MREMQNYSPFCFLLKFARTSAFHKTILFLGAQPRMLLSSSVLWCPWTKTGLIDSQLLSADSSGSVKRVGLTSRCHSMLKDLIPLGRKQRYIKKKVFSLLTAKWFSWLPCIVQSCAGDEENYSRSAAPTKLAATSSPTATAAPPLLLLSAVLAAFFPSWALFRIRWHVNKFDN